MKKNFAKKAATIAAVSALTMSSICTNVFAYGEVNVSTSTFKEDTDNSSDFQNWRDNTWQAGASEYNNSGRIALTPGKTEKDLNFAWYSETKGTPAVKVWKDGARSAAKVIEGQASDIAAENWQGSTYAAANKVEVENYFEADTVYYYQYTDNYNGDSTVWSAEYKYSSRNADDFTVILTGDPQIGASGSSSDEQADDASVARDTYNWNITMQQALTTAPNAAFLLSAGDQIDKSGATSDNNKKTRESEYAGYLYPSVFRSLPIASTIGNHDSAGVDYSNHFNNPNAGDLGKTAAGGDYYFSYGDVLFVSLNSNNRNQEEHRTLLKEAVASNENAKWKVVIFHSDIYGSGEPHADTDAATNRIIFAPLMDEFDIDVCLTGHDHTYSRSYQILDGNVVDYDISDGSVTNPEGTLYITTGSGSGSKYYNLLNYTPYYIAERTNECLPAFSTISFTDDTLKISTYDYQGNRYADDFTIKKTDISAEEAVSQAEAKLADASKYTEETVNTLKTALGKLKEAMAENATAEDSMVSEIVTKYGTDADRVVGYGSIKNAEDKGQRADQTALNTFKKGLSTLLDKTIYAQNFSDTGRETLNKVSGSSMEEAKQAVVSAINGLKPVSTEEVKIDATNKASDSTEKTTPKTADNMTAPIVGALAAMVVGAGIVLVRKKEEQWDEN